MNLDPHAGNYYEWSPYNYVGANPIIRTDPDGKDWRDRIVGAVVGAVTNIVPGTTSLRGRYTPNDAADYNNTLRATDIVASGVGAIMIVDGGAKVGAGLTTAAAGGAVSTTGAGAIVGAPVAGAGLALAGGGALEAGAGAVIMSNASNNAAAGYNYGDNTSDSSSGNGSGSFNSKGDSNTDTRSASLRQAKDSNGVPRSQQPDKTIKPNTPEGQKAGLDNRNVVQYEYTNSNGKKISIRQDKPAKYNQGGRGDQKAHHNAGNSGEKLKQHHYYED